MRPLLLLAAAAALTSCAGAAGDPLSDADLIVRASAVRAVKEAPVDRVLGLHKGTPVIVDVRCGDVCPQNTVRIIHYTVEPGPTCTGLGGDTARIAVPVSIAVMTQPFCVPHVLYGKNLYFDRPYQK